MSSSLDAEAYLSVDTPENVAFGYEVAGLGSRFLATLADSLLLVLIQAVVGVSSVLVAWAVLRALGAADDALLPWLLGLFGLLAFALFWGYYIFFEMTWNGQSPGKRWAGLRVIRTDGTPITLTESLVRNLVRLIDFLPAYYGLGVLVMFVNGQSRRLGDLAAGTLVVRDRPSVTLASLSAPASAGPALPAAPPALTALAASWPLERLTDSELGMAEDFLRRRATLSGRAALAGHIVAALLRRLDVPEAAVAGQPTEDTLAAVVLAHHQRQAG